eukprot:354575-Chlamydomonas_euryale.AAC.7
MRLNGPGPALSALSIWLAQPGVLHMHVSHSGRRRAQSPAKLRSTQKRVRLVVFLKGVWVCCVGIKGVDGIARWQFKGQTRRAYAPHVIRGHGVSSTDAWQRCGLMSVVRMCERIYPQPRVTILHHLTGALIVCLPYALIHVLYLPCPRSCDHAGHPFPMTTLVTCLYP